MHDIAVKNIDLVGVIRAHNIAFKKWIAVCFALDKWQTTSEVTARYKESLFDGRIHHFTFVIKLSDTVSRAEGKTLYLAVRYSVAGREIWDNNNGRNYQVQAVCGKALKAEKETVPMLRSSSLVTHPRPLAVGGRMT